MLADAPALYWKLDDPNGPAASDSSGNAQPGVYAGTFSLGLAGPEVGSHAALFQDGGIVFSLGATPRLVRPFSFDCWVATQFVQPTQQNGQYNGNGSLNGIGWQFAAGVSLSQPIDVLVGGIAIGAAAGTVPVGSWHHIAFVSNVTQLTSLYIDGVLVYGPANTGPINAIGAADKFQVGANKGGQLLYIAHAALYAAALTGVRVAAHFAANVTAQSPSPVGGVTSVDISSINAKLADILASVRKIY